MRILVPGPAITCLPRADWLPSGIVLGSISFITVFWGLATFVNRVRTNKQIPAEIDKSADELADSARRLRGVIISIRDDNLARNGNPLTDDNLLRQGRLCLTYAHSLKDEVKNLANQFENSFRTRLLHAINILWNYNMFDIMDSKIIHCRNWIGLIDMTIRLYVPFLLTAHVCA